MITLVKALAAQALGLAIALILAWTLPTLFYGAWRLTMVQGSAAAFCGLLLRQPNWWFPIHSLFLPMAIAMLKLQLPSWLYLFFVLLLVFVYWGTVKGDVPLFLSSADVAEAVANIAEQENASTFADLGAGTGSIAVPLARRRNMRIDAWERAPLPWLVCRWRCRKLPNVIVRRASFWSSDLAGYGLVFVFLSPAVMVELGDKVRQQMRPGSLFISSSFPVPAWQPESIVQVQDRRKTMLYCYRV